MRGTEGSERVMRDFRLTSVGVDALFKPTTQSPRHDVHDFNDTGFSRIKGDDRPDKLINGNGNSGLGEINGVYPELRLKTENGDNLTNYSTTTSGIGTPSGSQGKFIDVRLVSYTYEFIRDCDL